jgi:ABC-type Co2+ transport system permease subunit
MSSLIGEMSSRVFERLQRNEETVLSISYRPCPLPSLLQHRASLFEGLRPVGDCVQLPGGGFIAKFLSLIFMFLIFIVLFFQLLGQIAASGGKAESPGGESKCMNYCGALYLYSLHTL